jgi:DNA helicase HerA-like ATPase
MYTDDNQFYVAHCDNGPIYMIGKMANRHGLIAGATGTGKTVTLQVLAESFSQAGVPCFMADMKGDLSGISQAGKMSGFIEKRLLETQDFIIMSANNNVNTIICFLRCRPQ